MKLLGSLTEIVSLIFRNDSQTITFRPNTSITYTAARDIQTPAQDANSILVSRDSTDTLTNKTISGAANTISNVSLTTGVTGVLPTANGGTGQNSTATFPTSGVVVTEAGTQTLTGKTIDGDLNTVQDLALTSLKTVLGDANKVIRRDASGIVVSDNTIPNSSALVTIDATQDLSNKELTAPLVDDYLDINEESAPSTPASGRVRVYAKTDKKLYKKDSTGLETSIGGSGAGEKNYVANPDESTNWVASGAGITVATTTTAAVLPEESKLSGILLTGVSGTDYARYRFTMDDADKSKKNKIQFAIKSASGYATNDFKVEMYTNTASNYSGSYTSLTVQTSSQIPKNDNGAVLQYTFDSDTSDYYELRITRVAGTSNIVISGVIVGPGIVAQGAVVNGETFTSTIVTPNPTRFGTVSQNQYWHRQVGDMLEIRGYFTAGTLAGVGADSFMTLAGGYTIDSTRTGATSSRTCVGHFYALDSGTANFGSDNRAGALWIDSALGSNIYFSTSTNGAFIAGVSASNGSTFAIRMTVPVTQLTGRGTVNLLQEDNLTGWNTYSLTIGAITTPPTKGTIVYDNARWRRVGDSMEIRYDFRQSTGGSAGSGAYLFPLPTGYTMDTTKITPSTNRLQSQICGHGFEFADGGTVHTATARAYNTTNIWMMDEGQSNGGDNVMHWSSTDNGRLSLTGMTYGIRFTVPITEFRNSQNALVGFAGATSAELGLVKLPSSRVYVHTGNGFGSTATRRRRFTTAAVNTGSNITYADSASNGGTFTINETGLYAITYGDKGSAQHGFAISRNSAGNVNPGSLTVFTQRMAKVTIGAGLEGVVSWTGHLSAGDVAEAIADTANNDTTDEVFFSIVQLTKA